MNLTGNMNPAVTDSVGGNNFNTPLTINLSATSVFQITGFDIVFSSITGPGGLTKTGNGPLGLANSNSYAGQTTINAGDIVLDANNALGTAAAGTVVNSGGTLTLSGVNYTTAEPLTLNGSGGAFTSALEVQVGPNTFAGNITVASDSSVVLANANLTLTGTVNSSGSPHNLTFSSFSGSGGEGCDIPGGPSATRWRSTQSLRRARPRIDDLHGEHHARPRHQYLQR